ncbi:MAG: hypothetical protein IPJ40_15705 [Saprospirales bacterium]|nr:hypothetical protein [Saprospirales bacterium]
MTELKTPTEIALLTEADRPDLIPFLTSFWRSERMVAGENYSTPHSSKVLSPEKKAP